MRRRRPKLSRSLKGSEEAQPSAAPLLGDARHAATPFEKLPIIDIDEVVGICEVVYEYAAGIDFYDLAREFGSLRLMPLALEGARMLGLLRMRNGEIALSPLGRSWIQGDAKERQRVLHDQLSSLKLIRWLCSLLRASGSGAISEKELLSKMSALVPLEEARSTFWTLVNWGSYAGLFQYEGDRKRLVLRSRARDPMA